METDKYNILLTPTSELFTPTLVTMLSAMLNCKKKCCFYIMQFNWTERQKQECKELVSLYPGHTVEIIQVDNEQFKIFKVRNVYSRKGDYYTVYYKLLAHSYLPETIGRVLYLDIDTAVYKDPSNYYTMDFGDNYFIGSCNMISKNEYQYYYDNPQFNGCLNTGIVLLNIKKLRADGIDIDFYKNKLKELVDENYWYDQGVLNYCFKDKIIILPSYKYNHRICHVGGADKPGSFKNVFAMSMEERIEKVCIPFWDEEYSEEENATIVHYSTGCSKPWSTICKKNIDGIYDVNIPVHYTVDKDDIKYYYLQWWEMARKLPAHNYEELLIEAVDNFTDIVYVAPQKKENKSITNVKNFFEKISYDFFDKTNFISYIQNCTGKKIALIGAYSTAGSFLRRILSLNHVDVIFKANTALLTKLTDNEWEQCKQADIIINCDLHGSKPVERDGIKPIMILDILNDSTKMTSK